MNLYKRVLTQLAGKMGPALRVVSETAPLGVARCSFGTTKHLASRLAYRYIGKGREHGSGSLDWRCFRDNINNLIHVNRPCHD